MGGVPVPLMTWPARAVMVIVPAAGVLPAIAPVLQRTRVCALGITVGAPSAGDEELDTYVKPAGSVSWTVLPWSALPPLLP